ncbi:MAG: response regulator [Oligoflexia bacterium]|jgi:two-component system chemotaxis response regulator CheY
MIDSSVSVLVVDDMSTMRKVVMKACKELGFSNLSEAADGVAAWELISGATVPYGLVISDWNMPNCSGLDLLKRLRKDSRLGSTPFVMVTAETEKSQIAEAIAAGVSQYILKPFKTETLREKLAAIKPA